MYSKIVKKILLKKNIIIKKVIIIQKNFFWTRKIFFFLSKHLIMEELTVYELRPVARNRGIKNYPNMSREKL